MKVSTASSVSGLTVSGFVVRGSISSWGRTDFFSLRLDEIVYFPILRAFCSVARGFTLVFLNNHKGKCVIRTRNNFVCKRKNDTVITREEEERHNTRDMPTENISASVVSFKIHVAHPAWWSEYTVASASTLDDDNSSNEGKGSRAALDTMHHRTPPWKKNKNSSNSSSLS